jgi:dipeptidyl-peptidase-3
MIENETFEYTVEQFADLQLLRYRVPGFEQLSPRRKCLLYYLSEAALEGRDILFDQNGRHNLAIRRLLETVYTDYQGRRDGADFQALEVYLKRVWFASGIHHHYSTDKFAPGFAPEFLRQALRQVETQKLPLLPNESVEEMCQRLFPVIFDPTVLPKRVNQADGADLVTTSAANYYRGVTQAEAEAFYEARKTPGETEPVMYGMNSRLVKTPDGTLEERVWKADGLYGPAIRRIIVRLRQAAEYAENEAQRRVIDTLVQFYEDGNLHTFDAYAILWLKDTDSQVDFVNGFTETYGDPLGLKASWESIVNFRDEEATRRTRLISGNAQWFEDHSPVDPRFRKPTVKGVSAKVITAAILSGDLYPASAIGINLPNSNWIRSAHGSKSVTIGNLIDAYNEAAKGNGFREEFVVGDEERRLIDTYGSLTDSLHTDLHECLGHGSGQLLPGVDPDALKAYGATIEEARADLFGLYYLPDAKLQELGLTPNEEAYKAEYYSYMMNGLMTQLVRIEPGAQIEESHMRNRQLIARWAYEKGRAEGIAEMRHVEGKTYVVVNDYPGLRRLFGTLLAEIQRIKSEGDYEAARELVETYGVKVDEALHREVLDRYRALHLAPYKGFVNPIYTPVYDERHQLCDVKITYGESYAGQMLRYSRHYSRLPLINE